jgi:hypothetical protein
MAESMTPEVVEAARAAAARLGLVLVGDPDKWHLRDTKGRDILDWEPSGNWWATAPEWSLGWGPPSGILVWQEVLALAGRVAAGRRLPKGTV